jgi:hypothetical protein
MKAEQIDLDLSPESGADGGRIAFWHDPNSAISRQLIAANLWPGRYLAITDVVRAAGQYLVIAGEVSSVGAHTGGNAEVRAVCGEPRNSAVNPKQAPASASTLAPAHPVSS